MCSESPPGRVVLDLSRAHHEHLIGDGRGLRVVRHHDDRWSTGGQCPQPMQDGGGCGDVQCPGRLVREDKAGLAHQRSGDGRPLLLAAGELMRPVRGPVGEPELVERLCGTSRRGLLSPQTEGSRTLSRTVSELIRLYSWKMNPMCFRRYAARSARFSRVMSSPRRRGPGRGPERRDRLRSAGASTCPSPTDPRLQ